MMQVRNKTVIAALIAAAMGTASAQADVFAEEGSVTFSYNFFTDHVVSGSGVEGGFNEDNQFKGIRYNYADNLGIGIAKGVNSFYEDSVLVEAEFGHTVNSYVDIGAHLFVASGYDDIMRNGAGLLLGGAPFMRVKVTDYVAVKAAYMNFMAPTGFVEVNIPLDLK